MPATNSTNNFIAPAPLSGVLNTTVQALSKWLKRKFDDTFSPPRVKVSLTANQLIGSGVVSVVNWPAPTISPWQWQVGATFWSAGAPSRLTAPATGWYHVDATGQLSLNETGARFMGIFVGGAVWIAATMGAGNASFLWGGSLSCDLYMAAGDYVELGFYHTAGVNLNIDTTYAVAMSMRRIAKPLT